MGCGWWVQDCLAEHTGLAGKRRGQGWVKGTSGRKRGFSLAKRTYSALRLVWLNKSWAC